MRASIKAVDTHLRQIGRPFVRVDEARRACFCHSGPAQVMDFVIYAESGPNWLVTTKPLSAPGVRGAMREWQKLFGEGFLAAEVCRRRAGFVLVALDGTTTPLAAEAKQPALFA